MSVIQVASEVRVVDRHSLYGATHKFVMKFNEGECVPFSVWCESCQLHCLHTSDQTSVKFECKGEFDAREGSGPYHRAFMQRCSFSITFSK